MTTRALRVAKPARQLPQEALRYAEDGWAVFPVWLRGKTPLTKHGVKDATTIQARVSGWWRRWPEANIGLAVPSGFIVLDVDSADALQSLKHQSLELPSTSTSRTSRGWHFWYSVPRAFRNGVDVLPGIDVRSSGGYVIAPPSLHSSGAVYRWQVPLHREAISECPDWLIEILTEQSRESRARSAEDWREVVSSPVPEGRRNQTLAEVAGLLFRRLPARVAAEFAYCWAQVKLRPSLPEAEVLRTIDSIAGRELRRQGGAS